MENQKAKATIYRWYTGYKPRVIGRVAISLLPMFFIRNSLRKLL